MLEERITGSKISLDLSAELTYMRVHRVIHITGKVINHNRFCTGLHLRAQHFTSRYSTIFFCASTLKRPLTNFGGWPEGVIMIPNPVG